MLSLPRSLLLIILILLNFAVSYKIIPLSSDKFNHAYSPCWDEETQSLYFLDFLSTDRVLNRYDLNENRIYSASFEGNEIPAFLIQLKKYKNQFVGGIERSVKIFEWNGKNDTARVVRTWFSVEQAPKYDKNYWNIAKASPTHQFYGSTYRTEVCSMSSSPNASLYRFNKKMGPERLLRNEKVPAGIDWNIKENKFYHVDSCNGIIFEYDYNPKTGDICNERVIFDLFETYGTVIPSYIPLGLTIDTKGFLWVAIYYGSAVLKIDPRTSRIVKKIHLPAEIVTNLAFGGPNLDILFITTGSKAFALDSGKVLSNFSPESGTIYMIKGLKAKGYSGRKLCL